MSPCFSFVMRLRMVLETRWAADPTGMGCGEGKIIISSGFPRDVPEFGEIIYVHGCRTRELCKVPCLVRRCYLRLPPVYESMPNHLYQLIAQNSQKIRLPQLDQLYPYTVLLLPINTERI